MENNVEIWKDIIGFEGLYQISDYGNVKSCRRYVNSKFGKRVVNEKLLSLGRDKDGYLMAILCQDGIKKTVKIHRLVADAFIDKSEGKNIVNHIDSNKSNNSVENLEWITNKENREHALRQYRTESIIPKNYSLNDYKIVLNNCMKAKVEINILKKDILKDNKEVAQIINFIKKK